MTIQQYLIKANETRKQNFSEGRGVTTKTANKKPSPPKSDKVANKNANTKNPNNSNSKPKFQSDLDEIKGQLAGLTSMMTTFIECSNKTDERVTINERAIADVNRTLDRKLNYHDQCALNMKMEIQGETFDVTNLRKSVLNFLQQLGIEIELSEIVHAYNFNKRNRDEWKTVTIVVFTHELVKERVLRQKLQLKIDPEKKIYFNNVLTRANAAIQREGRIMQKDGRIFKVGFMNGKVYVIPRHGDSRVWIECVDDLYSLMENVPVSVPVGDKNETSDTGAAKYQGNALIVDDHIWQGTSKQENFTRINLPSTNLLNLSPVIPNSNDMDMIDSESTASEAVIDFTESS